MKKLFTSSRLFFREFTEDDAALILRLNSDAAVLRYVHELPLTDLVKATDTLNRILSHYKTHGYGRWAVFTKEDNQFIGWCGLKYREERNETDLGYRFIQSVWGKGFATEAAVATIQYGWDVIKLSEITAMAHIENTASLKLLEKIGFQFVGYETVDHCPVKTFRLPNEKPVIT